MGWSSGGAMASAFLDHAHRTDFITPQKTRFNISGVVLLSSGGQYCYAYNTIADLAGSRLWDVSTVRTQPAVACDMISTFSDISLVVAGVYGCEDLRLLPRKSNRRLLLAQPARVPSPGTICAI